MTMAAFVTGVCSLIHLYSIGYMEHDEHFPKFFIYLNLFVFSMLMLVLADNFLVTFFGWEGVGVCSYFLIAFWFERPAAASAGKKAMIYNRIGDAGFLVALFLIFERTGSLQLHDGLLARLGHVSSADLIGDRAVVVPRRRRQVGADPALPVARRRDGGPDAGLGADPRRDDGHRRRLPDVPDQPDPAPRARRRRTSIAWIGVCDRLRRRDDRLRADRHQEGARLLDGLPARLHVPGRRLRAPTSRRSS